ncbi:hypothetical protein [Acidovorax sp. 1608163]|uniref:hypothetical protein n=1 Tax=Acidovorax sp. 1608163 TaxID=2478662 RepID=UPI0013CEA988|nr:hypothetical protein [Acidovorax sp. 1608163]
MSRAEEIIAQQKQIEEELKITMQEERNAAAAVVDDKIKCLNITATELKGLIKSRIT